jgi:hypothetical protein
MLMPRMLREHILSKIVRIVAVCAISSACAMPRVQFDERQQARAQVAGFPHVRIFADSPVEEFPADPAYKFEQRKELVLLALSGGGADGAFGAGLLNGWTTTKQRPEFTIVSGVSTGALIAPFAFLGPAYDSVIKEIYTGGHAEQFVKAAHFSNVIFGTGLISASSAKNIISQFINARLLDDIAREHRKGRRLFVVTTNLDAQRPVLWDMGAIAASGRPDALSVFGDVLAASASFPGVFSPVLIDVEADGFRFNEMHVDGATTDPILAAPEKLLKRFAGAPSVSTHKSIYMLINTKLEPNFEVTQNASLQIPGRALWTMVATERRKNVLSAYEFAHRNGFKFNLAYLPKDIPDTGSAEFDTGYMRSLFEYGYELGRSGGAWHSSPPRPQ